MASLISPGVSVTITDESFFIPAAAVTVPLIFIATSDEKKQAPSSSGSAASLLDASGTFEHGVIRTVTSLKQSVALYGIPNFLVDTAGNPHHGDVRNEYGLFALNQFLGIGNRAYVVRANVNLNDNQADIRTMWNVKMQEASYVLENVSNAFINEFNLANGYVSTNPLFKRTVTRTELTSLIVQATSTVFGSFSFKNISALFLNDQSATPFNVYANGFNLPTTGMFDGVAYILSQWELLSLGTVVGTAWTPTEAGNTLIGAADDFKFTMEFVNGTSLGANDPARRVAVVTALQEAININTDIRSETYEYNLILCPGFPETADEMVNLSVDINEEAFVIADTPFTATPPGVIPPAGVTGVVEWGATSNRQTNKDVAYYYPHGFASNLDGVNVVCAASGVALRTITYSDEVSELWFAPAGTRRGVVTGVTTVGYVSGTLGAASTFNETALNQGQRDDMYKYFTNINPIVYFPGRGLIVWGQKTSSPSASALDRINVARLMMYIKRQLRKNTMSFVFEPNDQLTRDNLKAVVDSFLGDLLVKRGLYDFITVCDASNNTPDRIDRNELYIDVALKPVKAAEFIYIPIRVVNTGTAL
jgi:hypothetical protein